MKITLDQEGCIGCGLCAGISPELFAMDDTTGKAFVKQEDISGGQESEANEAADSCPVSVIAVG